MATLYVNIKANKHAPSARAKEAMTTTTSKAASSISTGDKTSSFIELFSTVAHLVHVSASPDADGDNAFYVFPSFPMCVEVGPGASISAKTLA